MAEPFKLTRISERDLKLTEENNWFKAPLYHLNETVDYLNQLSNKGIDSTNLKQQREVVVFVTPATYTSGDFVPIEFKRTNIYERAWRLSFDLWYFDAYTTPLPNAVSCWWIDDKQSIIVKMIYGLENSTKYIARFTVEI